MVSHGIKITVLLTLLCSAFTLSGQELCEGDLLFCCSDTANAITMVTSGIDELPIDHVAVVHRDGGDDGRLYVIEAVSPAVCLTPMDTFLTKNGTVLLGRVNVDCDVTASVKRCLDMIGKPYDDLYLPGDSAVYCSELVQLCYVTSTGEPVFSTIPMSFHDETGRVTDYWREFYESRAMRVPEGEPGTNPGELSRRPQITILGNCKK